MTDRAERERAAKARHGDPIAVRKRIEGVKRDADDWYTTCRQCGKQRRGSLTELRRPCGCDGTAQ